MDSIETIATQATDAPPAETENGVSKKSLPKNSPFFVYGLLCLCLAGLLRFFYNKYLNELLGIVSKSTLGHLISRESFWQQNLQRALFMTVYYLSAGYLVGQCIFYFTSTKGTAFTFWLWGFAAVVGIALLKRISIHSVSLVFRLNRRAMTYFNHISVFSQLTGFVLLLFCGVAMVLPSFLAKIFVILGVIIWFILLVIKGLVNVAYVRGLSGVSFFHFILYLCTLEFIPLAVCARYVYNGVGA